MGKTASLLLKFTRFTSEIGYTFRVMISTNIDINIGNCKFYPSFGTIAVAKLVQIIEKYNIEPENIFIQIGETRVLRPAGGACPERQLRCSE